MSLLVLPRCYQYRDHIPLFLEGQILISPMITQHKVLCIKTVATAIRSHAFGEFSFGVLATEPFTQTRGLFVALTNPWAMQRKSPFHLGAQTQLHAGLFLKRKLTPRTVSCSFRVPNVFPSRPFFSSTSLPCVPGVGCTQSSASVRMPSCPPGYTTSWTQNSFILALPLSEIRTAQARLEIQPRADIC